MDSANDYHQWVGSRKVTASVDLCLRMIIKDQFDYERDRKPTETTELLKAWFTREEIEQARALASVGVVPPRADLSHYRNNEE